MVDLQENVAEFEKRGVTMVAISVDDVPTSEKWAKRRGFTFTLASDPEMKLIDRFGIRNRNTPDLALHAIYIVDKDGDVFYRKVARRRAYSNELADAVDHFRGKWRPKKR